MTVSNHDINWDDITNAINEGRCKVSVLSKELNIKSADLRVLLTSHYGDRIEFRRGRNGGVFWSNNVESSQ